MLPAEIFISHSDRDRQFASDLVEVLRRHGVAVWYNRTDLVGSQQWHDEIGAALHRCDWFAIVLSPNAVNSMWVKRELMYALTQKRLKDKIIPLLYFPCEYSWALSGYQLVDFSRSFEDGCRDLLRVWGVGYKPISPNP